MSDIVERLRSYVACEGGDLADIEQAADEIERLRADLDWLQMRLIEMQEAAKRQMRRQASSRNRRTMK